MRWVPVPRGPVSPGLIQTDRPGWLQAAYEVEALGPEGKARHSTERVESGQSVLVAWPFEPLSSRERLSARVRVWGADGSASEWSAPVPGGSGPSPA